MIANPKQPLIISTCMLLALSLAACSDGAGQTPTPDASPDVDMTLDDMTSDMVTDLGQDMEITPENSGVVGRAVKGPFAEGAEIIVHSLDDKGQRTEKKIYGSTNEDGQFLVPLIAFKGWVEVEASGKYYDEVTGKISENTRTLSMLGRIEEFRVVGNINTFTTFAMQRVRHLLDTGIANNMEDARERARAEFSRIFYVGHHPEKLSILNVDSDGYSRDNAILLWFSTSLIQSGVDDQTYKVLVDDFTDDGTINGDGIEVFDTIKKAATEQGYETARQNLKTRFGSAPPELSTVNSSRYWIFNNCYVPRDTKHQKICVGQNKDFGKELPTNEWSKYSFIAPFTGTYSFGANFSTFHNFNRWTLSNEEGSVLSSGDSGNNWNAVSFRLDGGTEYVFSAFNRSEDPTTIAIDVQPSSEGSSDSPKPLMYDVSQEGWVGFHGERDNASWNSYYVFYADQTGDKQLSIQISDFNDDMELLVYGGGKDALSEEVFNDESKLIKKAEGNQSLKVDVDVDTATIFVIVRNKGSRLDPLAQIPGRVPYKIKIY